MATYGNFPGITVTTNASSIPDPHDSRDMRLYVKSRDETYEVLSYGYTATSDTTRAGPQTVVSGPTMYEVDLEVTHPLGPFDIDDVLIVHVPHEGQFHRYEDLMDLHLRAETDPDDQAVFSLEFTAYERTIR